MFLEFIPSVNDRHFLLIPTNFPLVLKDLSIHAIDLLMHFSRLKSRESSEYRRYDPRLKNLVAASDDIRKFLKFGISLSTLREWNKNGVREFFTIPELDLTTSDLIAENMTLKSKTCCCKC